MIKYGETSFNSTLVQLKAVKKRFVEIELTEFQFYLSSIKRRNRLQYMECRP